MSNRSQKIVFVTGKGGVGKSTVALALAAKEASQGKRVLLAELGEHSFYRDYLPGLPVSYLPQNFVKNLDICIWSGKDCLREYAIFLLKLESLYRLFFENRVSRTLIEVAPALPELSILGKITSGIRKVGPTLDYDLLVIDGYSTGHMLALLRAPRGMLEAISFGPMGEQSRTMLATIRNSEICQYKIVTLPEELPVAETEELAREIEQEVGIKPEIVLNKVMPRKVIESLEAKNSKELDFLGKLKEICQDQESFFARLQKVSPSLKIIPQFYIHNSKKLMDLMVDQL